MGAEEHRARAGRRAVSLATVTVSDTRQPETDKNQQYLEARLRERGHRILAYRLIPDEAEPLRATLAELTGIPAVQLIIFNGGTGIAPRDRTYDVLARQIEKPLPGFGELFRMLSYEEVGAAAMLSRATAGVLKGKLIFSLPGSENAVRTALEKLILPEIEHLAWELAR